MRGIKQRAPLPIAKAPAERRCVVCGEREERQLISRRPDCRPDCPDPHEPMCHECWLHPRNHPLAKW